ncbi:hypothetical protein LPJ61_004711, partial [Coemansia biformis]
MGGLVTIAFHEEAHAIQAAAKKVFVNGKHAEAHHPIQHTAQMTILSVCYSQRGSAVAIARYLEEALSQYGTIVDIVLRILTLKDPSRDVRVTIDRTGQEGDIPAILVHKGMRMTLTGER